MSLLPSRSDAESSVHTPVEKEGDIKSQPHRIETDGLVESAQNRLDQAAPMVLAWNDRQQHAKAAVVLPHERNRMTATRVG